MDDLRLEDAPTGYEYYRCRLCGARICANCFEHILIIHNEYKHIPKCADVADMGKDHAINPLVVKA